MSTVQARAGYIAKSEFGVYPELRFEYTPLDYEGRQKIDKAQREARENPEKSTLLTCSTIKNHLQGWEANQSHLFSHVPGNPDGDALPLTVTSVRQLKPMLIDRLFLIIMGFAASDPVPGASDEESEDYADTIIKAASENKSPGNVAEEKETGN
jgi:hypothetical protein